MANKAADGWPRLSDFSDGYAGVDYIGGRFDEIVDALSESGISGRRLAIFTMMLQGVALGEIADHYGLTPERVYSIFFAAKREMESALLARAVRAKEEIRAKRAPLRRVAKGLQKLSS